MFASKKMVQFADLNQRNKTSMKDILSKTFKRKSPQRDVLFIGKRSPELVPGGKRSPKLTAES